MSSLLSDFEKREQELIRLNNELEERSQAVLKQTSLPSNKCVANKISHSSTIASTIDEPIILAKNTRPSTAPAVKKVESVDKHTVEKSTVDKHTVEKIKNKSRLQQARIEALEEELESLSKTRATVEVQANSSEKDRTSLQTELKKERAQLIAARDSLETLQDKFTKASAEAREANMRANSLESENDSLNARLRKLQGECNAKDVRIHKLYEEAQKYKSNAQVQKFRK
eukprot:GHVL01006607.1.p1 GENE.GHVL01006607.1~~GHVL01006607.1.p1  ORF type:complete len:228 (+),score=53.82 GHVL01006607.1:83-766(+)